MESVLQNQSNSSADPLCPVFGQCGGCSYQNISYEEELKIKERYLRDLVQESLNISDQCIIPIVPSPKPYHYRNRLDLKLKRTRSKDVFIGFTPVEGRGVIPVNACYIAEQSISDYIPSLKEEAIAKLTDKYRNANLTIRTGDAQTVHWGGIGRRSCELREEDYFWTEIEGQRIFYSLDTFFQGNLSILPKLFKIINNFTFWNSKPTFYDLYGGVGLFGVGLNKRVKKVMLIEENTSSLKVARYNVKYNQLDNVEIIDGRVENELIRLINKNSNDNSVAMIDPPRAGLSEDACQLISAVQEFSHMLYLSCNPESLIRDLKKFVNQGWGVETIVPFDFFPKTKHLEVLVLLKR